MAPGSDRWSLSQR